MNINLSPYFKKYEELSAKVEGVFKRVCSEHSECVKCKIGCSDCCYALFDLTLIEALYVNLQFNNRFKGREREQLIDKANNADRQVYKIKKKAYKALESGRDEADILNDISMERVKCVLLNEEEMCDLYEYRPITCRLYGIPTSIGGSAHTCGKSGFAEGEQYPTVNIDKIHEELYKISAELVKDIKSEYFKMGEMLVPLSMAVLTVYDEEYLGIGAKKSEEKGDDNV